MTRTIGALAFALALACGCAAQPEAPVTSSRTPRLVVLLAVDGLPYRQLVDYRDQLAPDGFARFIDRGAWFTNAHYGQSTTVTAVGHAMMLTGAYPERTGIIGNSWRSGMGDVEYCAADPAHTYIGHETSHADGTSPRNLRVETLGDVLRGVNASSKVIGVSGKDRGAIFTAGHKGTAYIYRPATGRFASSTYYMKEHPKWVDDFNAADPAGRYFKAEWKPLLAATAYAKSLPDSQPWYARGGALPKTIGEGDRPAAPFYAQLLPTPFSDRLTLDFAHAAIVAESLGKDDTPDILAVSLSAHDFVNHAYGPESRLSHDHTLQLDRVLQDFFRRLDETVGRGNYVAVLTADHGFMPVPEYARALGGNAGRINGSQVVQRLNRALSSKYGQGEWVRYFSVRAAVLNRATIAATNTRFDDVAEDVRKLLLDEAGVAAAYTRAQLESGSAAGQPYFEQVRRSRHRDLSGDVEVVLSPYWMFSSGTSGTTHGSPHEYDTHVPLAFYGPVWIKAGRRDERVAVVDLAPTLAALLGVPPPAASQGRALPLR